MSTALSKRHQARNERALQELIRTVPGNDRCADCQSKNPGWASWSLGIFLCMRCASIHRKLGTHVSKVKSLSMDSWTSEQVDNMRRIGNADSNRTYNPKNIQPPIPFDADEVDAAMEKFIRQKYVTRTLSSNPAPQPARQDTGASYESDELPPPPPPKAGRRFGFGLRSASSALALPLSKTETSPPHSPEGPKRISQTPGRFRVNKQSRVFGATIGLTEQGNEWKLTTLREMGFPDDDRNANVLRGLNGDLEKAIESLARLGEGASHAPKAKSPITSAWPTDPLSEPKQSEKISRSVTMPLTGAHTFDPFDEPPKPMQLQSRQTTGNSNNPFDRPTQQPQRQKSYNPFDLPNQVPVQPQQQPLEQAFQNMHVSPPPLFPNSTGGHPHQQQQLHQARLQQSMTPPVPQLPPQYHNPWAHSANTTYNPYLNQQQQSTPANPYQTAFQTPTTANQFFAEVNANSNPYAQQQQPQQQLQQTQQQWTPAQSQSPIQQQNYFNLPAPPSAFPGAASTPTQQNPFPEQTQSYHNTFQPQPQPQQEHPAQPQSYQTFQPQQPQQQQFQPTAQPLVPQRTGRFDNQTILNLYNYPQLAPPPLLTPPITNDPQAQPPMPPVPQPLTQVNRSVTMPVSLPSGSKNPFLAKATPGVAAYGASMASTTGTGPMGGSMGGMGHASQESMESSGRHSPDAFASLSARTVW